MAQKRLDPDHHKDLQTTIERVKRLQEGFNISAVTSTFEKEIITVLQQDNERLVGEVERLQQVVSDLRSQRTLEGVRALELEFPRKGKSRSISRRSR